MLTPWKESYDNLDIILKSRDISLSTKVRLFKAMVFPVVMYGCESWTIKKAKHWRIDAFELWCWRRLLRVPWTARRSNQSILKQISPACSSVGFLIFEAETPVLWPSDAKNWLIWKDPDAGKDWRQEEKGMTEDEMVGWHHWLNGHEFGWTPGVGDGQGGLACCSSWVHESDTTEWLNWIELTMQGTLADPCSGKMPHAAGKQPVCVPQLLSLHIEPRSNTYWSPGTLKPMFHNQGSPTMRRLHAATRESLQAARKTQHSQSQINKSM